MRKATSKDGTTIAYEMTGKGQVVILVNGALSYRAYHGSQPLAAELAKDFTAITYDRRGRGESNDTLPYALDREIEDIEALIDEVGGPVLLFGSSSGAALALKAAAKPGGKVAKLALYEPPFAPLSQGDKAREDFAQYDKRMAELLHADKRGDAVAFFLADMLPAEMLEEMRQSPEWPIMEAVAPTLAYDNAVLGDSLAPVDDAKVITMPALVLDGSDSLDFMREAADDLAKAMPKAHRRTLEGQTHQPTPEALVPELRKFFK